MLGLGIGVQKFKQAISSGLQIIWNGNPDLTYSNGGTLIEFLVSTGQNEIDSTVASYDHTTIDMEVVFESTFSGTSNWQRAGLESVYNALEYSCVQYYSDHRLRIYENGAPVFHLYENMLSRVIRMYWNGSAMEYYVDGILKYTGSYDHTGADLYLLIHFAPSNFGAGNSIEFSNL